MTELPLCGGCSSVSIVGFLAARALMLQQANDAFTFFSQSIAICRPYVEERKLQMFLSRFAAVRSKADYLSIIAELKRIAAANRHTLPAYDPW